MLEHRYHIQYITPSEKYMSIEFAFIKTTFYPDRIDSQNTNCDFLLHSQRKVEEFNSGKSRM